MRVATIRRIRRYTIIYAIVIVALVFTLFPFYWMVKSSLTPDQLIYTVNPSLIPEKLTLSHYQDLLQATPFMSFFLNSVYVSLLTTLVAVVISILGSYSLTRLKFRGRLFFSNSIIFSYLLPAAVLFIPMYVAVSSIGLGDNKNALILVYLTFTVPYSCYMLISYFKAIPESLEEAAMIDGCSRLQSLFKIILPIAAPSIAVVATFAFTLAWNEYLYAYVITTSPSQETVTIGIASFQFSDQTAWGLLLSSSVIASLPPVILYLIAQAFVVGGLTDGGVKG
jgi:multiple sugar transport system permease protein